MLSGFNTNIRHRGVLFHVQSEDSGRARPHIITHLYYGGTILASEKRSYAEHLDDPNLSQLVRDLMEAQHKSVVERLRSRDFDDVIRDRLGSAVFDESTDSKAQTAPANLTPPAASVDDASGAGAPAGASGRPFGEGIVSEKPLDEVILNFLVENARKRKRQRS
jgi:hypothetical protein